MRVGGSYFCWGCFHITPFLFPLLTKHQLNPSQPHAGVVWAGLGLHTATQYLFPKVFVLAVTSIFKCAYFISKGKPYLVVFRAYT